jgi:SAM-dependent methyltransferase
MKNKNHWYDGWFYDKFVAPNQDRLFQQIKNIIEPGSKVIDVGCGTGRFSFLIADKCESVLGVDISKRNINRAIVNLQRNPNKKISFKHTTLEQIIEKKTEHFDYAISTYVIHEVDETERINLLKNISKVADKIIIGDYLYPNKTGVLNLFNEVVEFAAGSDHYHNFKSFFTHKGIEGLVDESGLRIIQEIKNDPPTSHIALIVPIK